MMAITGTQSNRTSQYLAPSRYGISRDKIATVQVIVRRYVSEAPMIAWQCGHENVGVSFTSSSRTFKWHSGHLVRSEYDVNSITTCALQLAAALFLACFVGEVENIVPVHNVIEMLNCPTGNRGNWYAIGLKSCRETHRSPCYCPWY